MDLESLANLAEIFGAMLVIGGMVLGVIEIRNYRTQRQESAAMEIMRAFQSPEFTHAIQLVMEYEGDTRDCCDAEVSSELLKAVMLISTTLESIGLMVYRRSVPFRLVQQLMGGTIQACWSVLSSYVTGMRDKAGRASLYEWFQWLAERLDQYPEYLDAEGAYVKYQNWRPERQRNIRSSSSSNHST